MKVFEIITEAGEGNFNPELRNKLRRYGQPRINSYQGSNFPPEDTLDVPVWSQGKKNTAQQGQVKSDDAVVDQFNRAIIAGGYQPTPVGDRPMSIDTSNNIKLSLVPNNKGYTTVEVKNIPKNGREAVETSLTGEGISLRPRPSLLVIDLPKVDLAAAANTMIKAAAVIDSLGPDFKSSGRKGRGASSRVKRSPKLHSFYVSAAKNILNAWWDGEPSDLRRGGGDTVGKYDTRDYAITIGYTKEGLAQQKAGKNPYREHVVPCDAINNMGLDICEDQLSQYSRYVGTGRDLAKVNYDAYTSTIEKIADMIQRNLAIVLCSNSEREYIDFNMGWQSTMPEGWKDGDEILARFTQCVGYPNKDSVGIPVYSVKGGQRLQETNV